MAEAGKYPSKTFNVVALGFGAEYAAWVHENVGAKFQRPGAGAKFLEAALKREQNNIEKIIQATAKIKG